MADLSFPRSLTSSEDGLEFVRYAFTNLPQLKGNDARFSLSLCYDEYMQMNTYTALSLNESPLSPMRQWPSEDYGSVSHERDRMKLYVVMQIAEHFPGMNWAEFNKLTPEQTEWVLDIVAEEKRNKSNADNKAIQGLTKATNALQKANL